MFTSSSVSRGDNMRQQEDTTLGGEIRQLESPQAHLLPNIPAGTTRLAFNDFINYTGVDFIPQNAYEHTPVALFIAGRLYLAECTEVRKAEPENYLTLKFTFADGSTTMINENDKAAQIIVARTATIGERRLWEKRALGDVVNISDLDAAFEYEADPLAQTDLEMRVDPLAMTDVGSILDLTSESDDTSLGAELLEEIYTEDSAEDRVSLLDEIYMERDAEQPREKEGAPLESDKNKKRSVWDIIFG